METISAEKKVLEISDEELFRDYSEMVYRLSLARVSERAAAEDILQEVF